MPDVAYILGHSPAEIGRLIFQAGILKPITERLLREAGVAPGMRVLDLGCGTGDVALLAAELVGPNGAVVGIDRNDDVLAAACDRARAAGYANIEFREGAAEDFVDPVPFDLAIGRYVLVHQADPTTFIRSAASHVRPDGLIVFHEIAVYGECHALPPVPLWEQCWNWVTAALRSVMTHPDAAGRMTAYFHDAGLKRPTIFCEVPVGGGPDSPLCAWLARSVRSVLPQLEEIGAATAAEVDIETLEDRLRDAVSAVHSQVLGPMQFCGWTKL
jgi:ubiquinone/menaquinone biosynthesis C-methylase UbiE